MKQPQVTIHGFYASKNQKFCEIFSGGRNQVLFDHGFTGVVTNDDYWHGLDHVYCFLAFDQDNIPTGGIRLERKIKGKPLDFEKKLINHPEVSQFMKSLENENVAEACGLWNSKNAISLKLAILFARLCAAIAPVLGYDRVLSFSSTYTYRLARSTGAEMVKSLGDKGQFDFPSKEFRSSVFLCSDLENYNDASDENKSRMRSLRMHPRQTFVEDNIVGGLKVNYEIEV